MDVDPQLVSKITDAVLAALAARATSGTETVSVHAPIGICTGDYSKFPELAGKQTGAAPPEVKKVENIPADTGTTHLGPVLTGVITASKLSGIDGTVYLAPGARLSPLAMDVVKQRGLKIQTVSNAVSGKIPNTAWLWWMQGHCPSAARVIEQLAGKPAEGVGGSTAQNLPAAVRAAASALGNSKAKLAVLFVPAAARAVCLANRCPGLRAIVGTCRQAVQEGIDLLGANVLVLEYPHHGFKSMAELTGLFLTSPGYPPMEVQKQLTDLAACK